MLRFISSHPPPIAEEIWEFDTFKGPRSNSQHLGDDLSTKLDDYDVEPPHNSTIRPPNNSKVPSSLRALFQEEDMPPESFSAPTLLPLSLSPGNKVMPPMSTSPRDRTAAKKAALSDASGEESEHTNRPGFVFPPRPTQSRSNSKAPGVDSESDAEKVRNESSADSKDKLPPLGPGIPFGKRMDRPSDAKDKLPPLGPGIPFGKNRAEHSSEKLPPLGPGIPFGKARNELRSETREKLPPLGAGIPMGHGASLGPDEKILPSPVPRPFPVRSANKISFGEMDLDALKIRNEPLSDTRDKPSPLNLAISSGIGEKSAPAQITPANSSLSVSIESNASSPSRSRSHSPPPMDISRHSPKTMAKADSSIDKPFLPEIRPLDIGALMYSRDDTHAELARTVEELAQWLSVVETGFTDLLMSPAVDVIEEEQEDSSSRPDSSQPRGRLEGVRDYVAIEDDFLTDPLSTPSYFSPSS